MENDANVATKKEPKYSGVIALPFIIGYEAFEKIGSTGASANLVLYLTKVYHMKPTTATNVINVFSATCNFGTLIGAFLSDSYLGRYKTLGIASVSSFLGMLMLALTAAIPRLHPAACTSPSSCADPSAMQLAFLFVAFAFMAVGASGIRPCSVAFGADQFDPNTQSGKRGIKSFFDWYFFIFTLDVMISLTFIVYVQSNISWPIGLAIPAFMMFLSCTIFFAGTRFYVMVSPQGSPLTSVVQTLVVAFKKKDLTLPQEPLFNHSPRDSINSRLAYTDQLRCLNKAAILTAVDEIMPDGSAANPWNLRSVQQVEEMKCIIKVIPVWIAGVIYFIGLTQAQTYPVLQALQADRRLGNFTIPSESYSVFVMLSLTTWIPIYDRIIVPFLRRMTRKEGGITMLQRIGIGIILLIISMIISGAVESNRRSLATTRSTLGGDVSSMSANLLIPQMAVAGLSEAFTVIGLVEFFHQQYPENMKSFGGSFIYLFVGTSSYLSIFLISLVNKVTGKEGGSKWIDADLNKGRLDYFYYLVGALQVVNFAYLLAVAKWYKYKIREDSSSRDDVAGETHSKKLIDYLTSSSRDVTGEIGSKKLVDYLTSSSRDVDGEIGSKKLVDYLIIGQDDLSIC